MHLRGVVLFAVLALGQGCMRSMALRDPELRRRAANITLIKAEDLSGRRFTFLGEVEASSCTSGIYRTNYSPAALQEMLKGEAARLHADAVTNIACSEGGMRFQCYTSYECRGDAIRWDEPPSKSHPGEKFTLLSRG
ncbi:Rcs stress response system protein RcsF [Corallococcus sp. Z5C101001]|uniref:Rcs stress response system protein RcsF n=1 Tax=Corallococcus sp. Z5C101001 TaxID=2596829 RepID=UPI00163DD0E2|nr:Rcs stress response system protein RcsF [Corallococcus sp. Z5C101001]